MRQVNNGKQHAGPLTESLGFELEARGSVALVRLGH